MTKAQDKKKALLTISEVQIIREKYIGNGKVQSIYLKEVDDNQWEYRFKIGGKYDTIKSKNREILEQMHMEHGGRNPDTCRAPFEFLDIDGSWDSSNLIKLGHIPTKLTIAGAIETRNLKVPIAVPDECGEVPISKQSSSEVNLYLVDKQHVKFTRNFDSADQFDALVRFLLQNDTLKNLRWKVYALETQSKSAGQRCLWQRRKAGDGTQRMVLELVKLNGKNYTKCFRDDLHNAADGMFDAACSRIKIEDPAPKFRDACEMSLGDGTHKQINAIKKTISEK